MFTGLFDTATISVANFMLCVVTALVLGLVLALLYTFKNKYTSSFLVTLAILPAVVCVVIMMVNGNIGAGVAVAGAFSLIRFRSAPGNAREIASIFIAMGAGLITGMGYLGYAILFTLIMGGVQLALTAAGFGERKPDAERTLRITVPEDLNYTNAFDEIMAKYTDGYTLEAVKTTNMGSMFKLRYRLTLKDVRAEKEFIDDLRTRNGNLEIMMSIAEEKDSQSL